MEQSVRPAEGGVSSSPRAVVLGVEHPRGVAVVRSLGRHRVPVVAIERDLSARGLWSRYLSRRILVDDSPEQTLCALESLGQDGGLLIPTNDHFLMIVRLSEPSRPGSGACRWLPRWKELATDRRPCGDRSSAARGVCRRQAGPGGEASVESLAACHRRG
jgi:hypothetical protein